MALKSLLIGTVIGTAAALLLPKLLRRGAFTDWTHDHWREGQLEPEDSRSETHVPNFIGVREHLATQRLPHARGVNVGNSGRTVSRTESELRRTVTNPVRYTTDPSASPASGGTAPFLKEKKA